MSLIKPFRGLRPAPAAPRMSPRRPTTCCRPTRPACAPAANLGASCTSPSPRSTCRREPILRPAVYAKAAANLKAMLAAGVLQRDDADCYYAYRLTMGNHVQTGLVAAASVAAYDSNRIKKHEFTRPDKEDDRVRQIEALNAQTGPVLLAYPSDPVLDALLARPISARRQPTSPPTTASATRSGSCAIPADRADHRAFDAMPALYIADGHHRSAAASRVAAARRSGGTAGDGSSDYFLAVIFPTAKCASSTTTAWSPISTASKSRRWRHASQRPSSSRKRLRACSRRVPASSACISPASGTSSPSGPELIPADPVARLDVSLLSDHLLGPILGITDLRRDKRIDFVGGIRGLEELERRVDSGEMAVAFALYPTGLDQLMAVADANEVMPPKSTWFEPKLADGLVSHVLD